MSDTYFTSTVSMDRYNASLQFMTEWARSTVSSLVRSWQTYGRLTEKQAALMEKLVAEAEAKKDKAARPATAKVERLDLTAITAMFDNAKAKGRKRLKVRFLDETGSPFAVSPAGPTSRNAGMLYVKGEYDKYLGKIDQEGVFHGAWGTERDATTKAQAALVEFNRDPAGKAKAYGKLTSSCCFCGLELNDPRSVMAGYGPICADNYGLPIPSMKEAVAWMETQS